MKTKDSFNIKLIKALNIELKNITDICIFSHANNMVRVRVEYLLDEDNGGNNLLELLQEYYLIKIPDAKDKTK